MDRRTGIALAIVALAIASAMWLARPAPAPQAQPQEAVPAQAAPEIPRLQAKPLRPPPAAGVALTPEDHDFAQKLRDRFAPHMGDKHAQVRLLEQVLAYLEAHGFGRDLDRAYALIREMFPDLADALFAKLQGLLAYDDWLAQTRTDLAQLPREERRQRLWQARRELFGEDAAEIWAGELRADQVRASLDALRDEPQLTTQEKLEKYVDAIHQAYGDRAPEVIERSSTELLDQFMTLDSVQQDLAAMRPDQRRETLHEIRSAMGMDAAARERWDALDQARDQAWDVGEQYQQQRRQLASQYPAVELDARLHELQDRLFGAEAETIRAEEAAGFFRFGHRRQIGRE